mgnify:CR=1 FL=1
MSGFVDPYKLAKRQQSMQGSFPVASMQRATKLLASDQRELTYSLMFDIDEDNCCFIKGELRAVLTMRCQRCMQTFEQELNCNFKVSPVPNDEAAKGLSVVYEPVVVFDAKLDPAELIEDELILALPIVAMHDIEDVACKNATELLADKAQNLVNPFQVLQDLKLNKKGQKAGDKNGSTTES